MAASVSVPVWAETTGALWTDANKTVETGDLIVDARNEKKDGIGYQGTVNVKNGNLTVYTNSNGVLAAYGEGSTVKILANEVTIDSGENGILTYWAADEYKDQFKFYGNVIIGPQNEQEQELDRLHIDAGGQGIDSKKGSVNIYGSDNSEIYIHSKGDGGINKNQAAINSGEKYALIFGTNGSTHVEGGTITLIADGGSGIINQTNGSSTTINAISSVEIISNNIMKYDDGSIKEKTIDNAGINNIAGTTTITSKGMVRIASSKDGIVAQKGTVNLTSNTGNNIIMTAVKDFDSEKIESDGSNIAIKAEGNAHVDLNASSGNNELYGAIYADGKDTAVTLEHNKIAKDGSEITGTGLNIINSTAVIQDESGTNNTKYNVVSAAYAKDGATINISGTNSITTTTNDENSKERVVWAESGTVNITGTTYIHASQGSIEQPNSVGIALVAGGRQQSENKSLSFNGEDNAVGYIKAQLGENSNIFGDIVAGVGGKIDFSGIGEIDSQLNALNNSTVHGNALAANGGTVNMVLGEGTRWDGRADDYQDADTEKWNHSDIFAPEFANDITASGDVNVTLNEGAYWNVTGQSWVTSVNSNGGIIDLTNNETGEGNHAIHIGNLEGENTFRVNLSKDGSGNMIYIKDGTTAHQNLDIVNKNDVLSSMQVGDEIRFATIANSKGGFGENTKIRDAGIMNVDFDIVYKQIDEDDHQKDDDYNDSYNGGNGNNGIGETKPGTDYVEENYDIDENSYNVYIVRQGGGDISDPGKTVVNMSKVNYSNAVYMDRLNKRLGEARYINTEEDQGMWVRMRHDRIGKDNEFRIMNTMYELGYDEKQECDNGERRVGAAIDYMDGSSEYTGVGGSGDVSRKGIWLYDTWLGDKGHYSDFVAKWGHLSNDFTLYRGGDKITGDFSNNVYSISAEYGRKKDIGNNWYFEPQVQLQYARVTDANYTTSQGTEVSLDAINSLIARAGFRLGKDLGERSTVYFKADLLHEFLGDQDIYATDGTGTMDVTYGNEGTWCDIGFGFATAMSKTSYAYLDVETSLGNDYEETYQINAGLQWSF